MAYLANMINKVVAPATKLLNTSDVWPIMLSRFNATCPKPPVGMTSGSCTEGGPSHGLVLGAYIDDEGTTFLLTPVAQKFNDGINGELMKKLRVSGPPPKLGEVRVFYDIHKEFSSVAVVGLGKYCAGFDKNEEIDREKEAIRVAVGSAMKQLQKNNLSKISVEPCGHSESAAEGAALAVWLYQELRNKDKQLKVPGIDMYDCCDWHGWIVGLQKAAAQNLTRQLMDTPANLMTPTTFAQNAVEVLCRSGVNVEVKVLGWIQTQKMGNILHVARGSCEQPIFLELSYYGTHFDDRPVVMIGSGLTFDSGGVCLKSIDDMKNMRGDMNGAACVVATARAISSLQIPINFRGLIPLCENMPGCSAMKPGDVITAMNGTKVMIENTNCDGRLVIADTIHYSQNFWPRFVVDIGTLTKETEMALGTAATATFTNSDELWKHIKCASHHTGDRVWRYPLWEHFTNQVRQSKSVDIKSQGRAQSGGGTCRAAAFLREFVPCGEWMHLDTWNVMWSTGKDEPYLRTGMSGRPTRTLVELLAQLSCIKCD